jgi:hypothetical protein
MLRRKTAQLFGEKFERETGMGAPLAPAAGYVMQLAAPC